MKTPHSVLIEHSGKSGTISNTAETRTVHMFNKKNGYQFCAEPSPDVAESREADWNYDFTFLNFFHDSVDREKDFEEDTDVPLIGRTGYLLLARELGYRICEAQVGIGMTGKDYVEMHKMNTELLIKIATEEAERSKYKFVTKQDIGEELSMNTKINRQPQSQPRLRLQPNSQSDRR